MAERSNVNLAEAGDLETLKSRIGSGEITVDWADEVGDTLLHGAAKKEKVHIIRYLISNGANVNATNGTGSTPLHKAVIANCPTSVRLLLAAGADGTQKNTTGFSPEQLANSKMIQKIFLGDRFMTEAIHVPQDQIGLVIGKGGRQLDQIQRDTGALCSVKKKRRSKTDTPSLPAQNVSKVASSSAKDP